MKLDFETSPDMTGWFPNWVEVSDDELAEELRLAEDRRERPDQVPHLLVIDRIDFDAPDETEMHFECPCDHHAGYRHWCTDIYIRSGLTLNLTGATVFLGFKVYATCWVESDISNTGLFEMLGIERYVSSTRTRPDPPVWPAHMPQEPGEYPVMWACEGSGESFYSWLELVG